MLRILLWGLAMVAALGAQETPVIGTVTMATTVGTETIGQRQLGVRASVIYLDTLEPDKFVDVAQVVLDIQTIIQEFPNKQAAPDAYAAAICTKLLQKYPQMLGVSVGFANSSNTLAVTAQRVSVSAPVAVRSAARDELRQSLFTSYAANGKSL
ncbi:MAG: hypothetical protein K2Q23_17495 [Bryobacteraceae bacterium]|nr:hypothetical protein [Bryobacteraceae bacterium]